MRVIIVGAGSTTRAILDRLGDRWEVVVVDRDAERLARLTAVRQITAVEGDGSSRVVLERAGLTGADALVAALDDDVSNLEACRLAAEAGVERIAAVAHEPDALEEYRKAGITVVSPDRLASRQVEITLEPRRVNSAAFAGGRAEAIEFRISPDSPLRGRPLQEIALQGWLIAAVLRNDELIVPNGRTKLLANDLVTIVGAAGDHAAMVATFTGGQAHFPQPYGRNVAALLGRSSDHESIIGEAAAMARMLSGADLVIVAEGSHEQPNEALAGLLESASKLLAGLDVRSVSLERFDPPSLAALREGESIGLIALPKPAGRLKTVRTLELVRRTGAAALLVAGTYPYRGVVAPARDSIAGWSATWTAIDLAARAGLPLEALGVVPPRFVAGEHEAADARRAVARIRDEASVQGVDVSGRIETGNPVRVFRDLVPHQLLVLGLGRMPYGLLRPGITGQIVAGSSSSIVIVPDRTEG